MKTYTFEKQQINGKWYSVCISHEHVPMIEHCKDGKYKTVGKDGKARFEDSFANAKKFAIQTYKHMTKFNKNWDKENTI